MKKSLRMSWKWVFISIFVFGFSTASQITLLAHNADSPIQYFFLFVTACVFLLLHMQFAGKAEISAVEAKARLERIETSTVIAEKKEMSAYGMMLLSEVWEAYHDLRYTEELTVPDKDLLKEKLAKLENLLVSIDLFFCQRGKVNLDPLLKRLLDNARMQAVRIRHEKI